MTTPLIIRFQKLREEAKLPVQGSPGAAGYDLFACCQEPTEILPGQTKSIPTGLAAELPEGTGGFVFARSGLGVRHGIVPGNCVGVIDSDYRGEILVGLHNHGQEPYTVLPGERMAQLVLLPVLGFVPTFADTLKQSDRGSGGFGSTGTK